MLLEKDDDDDDDGVLGFGYWGGLSLDGLYWD